MKTVQKIHNVKIYNEDYTVTAPSWKGVSGGIWQLILTISECGELMDRLHVGSRDRIVMISAQQNAFHEFLITNTSIFGTKANRIKRMNPYLCGAPATIVFTPLEDLYGEANLMENRIQLEPSLFLEKQQFVLSHEIAHFIVGNGAPNVSTDDELFQEAFVRQIELVYHEFILHNTDFYRRVGLVKKQEGKKND